MSELPLRKVPERLSSILDVAESALTIGHIATFDLEYLDPSTPGMDARHRMQQDNLDIMPVHDADSVYRFVDIKAIDEDEAVDEFAQTIETRHLLPASVSLTDGLEALRARPFFLILRGRDVAGIVTRADIQRPPVGMLAFSLILAAEAGLNTLIDSTFRDGSWLDALTPSRADRARTLMEVRRSKNVEIAMIDCLMLEDRLRLACVSAIRSDLGYSNRAFDRWQERLKGVRDVLAHGGSILDFEPDPEASIELLVQVRDFAQTIWACVSEAGEGPLNNR